MDQNQTQGQTLPPLPQIPTGDEIYNSIMSQIEPELTSAQISLLEEKYKGETEGDQKVRMERYTKAFEEYEKQYGEYIATLDAQVRSFKRDAMSSTEGQSRAEDNAQLASLESVISQKM